MTTNTICAILQNNIYLNSSDYLTLKNPFFRILILYFRTYLVWNNSKRFIQKPLVLLLNKISCQQFQKKVSESKNPTRKGTLYKIDNFKPIIDKIIYPFLNNLEKINSCHFRSIFRAVIIYFTFCRFSDFKELCDQDFTNYGDFIEINFKKSKNV